SFCHLPPPPLSTLFPYTTLFRSDDIKFLVSSVRQRSVRYRYKQKQPAPAGIGDASEPHDVKRDTVCRVCIVRVVRSLAELLFDRSEEHTSELQSRENLVCRLLLE